MQVIIEQRLSVLADKVHVLTRLVESDTGKILDEFAGTYFDQDVADVVSATLAAARVVARQHGGTRILCEVRHDA